MKNVRVIARLDIKGPNVVKGVSFECLRVMGKPVTLAEKYYLDGADEIIYIDTVASLYQRPIDLALVHETAKRIFVPFTVGGGIKTIADIRATLKAGADKVAINTAAIRNPHLIAVHRRFNRRQKNPAGAVGSLHRQHPRADRHGRGSLGQESPGAGRR